MPDRKLWYAKPANRFLEALPLGCGRLGALVYGKPGEEQVSLNEDSIWAGSPIDRHNVDGAESVARVRRALLDGKLDEAHFIARHGWFGTPRRQNPYQCGPKLKVQLDDGRDPAEPYRRELSLAEAIATTRYQRSGGEYLREALCSHPDQVFAMRLKSSKPVRLAASLERRGEEGQSVRLDARTVATRYEARPGAVSWVCALRLIAPGAALLGESATALAAEEALLLVAIRTSFRETDPVGACLRDLDASEKLGWAGLRERHVADHRGLYGRLNLDLECPTPDLPTDRRLEALRQGAKDPDLEATFVDYGRYLLIASSRPGSLPANLQGVWNEELTPPWDAKYTININTEMNYWPAEAAGLGECHRPLFDLVERMAVNGAETAKRLYGAGGWCAHHNTDLWADTAPVDDYLPATTWPFGGAWLALHFAEHWRHGGDAVFLKDRAWPILSGAARFILDYLMEVDGRLVTGPSISPENTYILPDGQRGVLTLGATMDRQIADEVFRAVLEASAALADPDPALLARIRAAMEKMLPPAIGKHGQLVEWLSDFEEAEPGHRHISQLFGFYPGTSITPRGTPELAGAVKATIDRRKAHGGGQTGWSAAWLLNHAARLEDGEEAHRQLRALMAAQCAPNLMDLHPPGIFQIDGNLGGASGVLELFVQSHESLRRIPEGTGAIPWEIRILPALPRAWPNGSLSGFRTRGGLVVDLAWQAGKLTHCALTATRAGAFRIHLPEKDGQGLTLKAGETRKLAG